jgi:hypothetical protein
MLPHPDAHPELRRFAYLLRQAQETHCRIAGRLRALRNRFPEQATYAAHLLAEQELPPAPDRKAATPSPARRE